MKNYWVNKGPSERQLKSSFLMVSAGRFTPIEANIIVGRIQAEGIRAEAAASEDHVLNHLYAVNQGSVDIMVPNIQLERAQEIIVAIQDGDYRLTDDADVGSSESDG